MELFLWLAAGALALYAGWWGLKIVTSIAVAPEIAGRAFLKQELQRAGVDVGRIPDRAIDEIVQYCLSGARGMAAMHKLSSRGMPEHANWRANLVVLLRAHVPSIKEMMVGDTRPSPSDTKVREILVSNGVLRI